MAIDFVSGLALAGAFRKSLKSEGGALDSRHCFKGLVKKGMMLMFILIGHRMDMVIGTDFVRTAVIIAFICNELISITENAGLMGVPVPVAIRKGIDVLNGKNQKL
jgi:toxin secretion/phage lysis holin